MTIRTTEEDRSVSSVMFVVLHVQSAEREGVSEADLRLPALHGSHLA
jgi:hypothetical protein